ncbi:MAG: ABC transporter permease [Clostridiaceae bacterium]
MYNAIYCEFLKLKKSNFFIVLALMVSFFPGVLCAGWLAQGQYVTWNHYILQAESMAFILINAAMYAVIASYIFSREFSCNTAQTLYSYPVSRIKIFIAKFLVIIIIIFFMMVIQLLLTILGGMILPHEEVTKEIILAHLKVNSYALIFQFDILPIAIFISLLSRNIIAPIVYGGLVTVTNACVMGAGVKTIMDYVPSMYPILILFNSFKTVVNGESESTVFIESGLTLPSLSYTIAFITFMIGVSLCIGYYYKADID